MRAFSSCGELGPLFIAVRGPLTIAALSLSRPLLLRSTGSRRAGSAVVAHGPSCSAACGIFPDQGSNPCPLHWQAVSQPLRHQGSPSSWTWVCWIQTPALFVSGPAPTIPSEKSKPATSVTESTSLPVVSHLTLYDLRDSHWSPKEATFCDTY